MARTCHQLYKVLVLCFWQWWWLVTKHLVTHNDCITNYPLNRFRMFVLLPNIYPFPVMRVRTVFEYGRQRLDGPFGTHVYIMYILTHFCDFTPPHLRAKDKMCPGAICSFAFIWMLSPHGFKIHVFLQYLEWSATASWSSWHTCVHYAHLGTLPVFAATFHLIWPRAPSVTARSLRDKPFLKT